MTKVFNKPETKQRRQALRRSMPESERNLWSKLRNRQVLGYKFRRQYGVHSYFLDFYSPAVKLAVEVDGASHSTSEALQKDRVRQPLVETYGIRFLRFKNEEVRSNLFGVLEAIAETLNELNERKKRQPPA